MHDGLVLTAHRQFTLSLILLFEANKYLLCDWVLLLLVDLGEVPGTAKSTCPYLTVPGLTESSHPPLWSLELILNKLFPHAVITLVRATTINYFKISIWLHWQQHSIGRSSVFFIPLYTWGENVLLWRAGFEPRSSCYCEHAWDALVWQSCISTQTRFFSWNCATVAAAAGTGRKQTHKKMRFPNQYLKGPCNINFSAAGIEPRTFWSNGCCVDHLTFALCRILTPKIGNLTMMAVQWGEPGRSVGPIRRVVGSRAAENLRPAFEVRPEIRLKRFHDQHDPEKIATAYYSSF